MSGSVVKYPFCTSMTTVSQQQATSARAIRNEPGNVGMVDGKPQVHAHGAVGFPDGQVHGGHLLHAFVWLTLELFFTALPATLIKKHDPETDPALFDLNATS
jgi:hypothetical protein